MRNARMKIAVGVLGGILLLVGGSLYAVTVECSVVLDKIAAVEQLVNTQADREILCGEIREMEKTWESARTVMQFFVPTTELEETDTLIARLMPLCESESEELSAECAAIEASVRRVKRGQFLV